MKDGKIAISNGFSIPTSNVQKVYIFMWDFRRCLVKPNVWQVQGHCYLDLFLFDPPRGSTSEIRLVETLIRSGKQKFLIHPLIEIFLKEKWGIIGKIYLVAGKVVHREILNVNEVVLGLPSLRKAKKRLYKLQYFSSILLGILRFPQWFRFHQLWPILVR